MNEKLEQEIDKWFGIYQRDATGKPIQEISDWKESPDVMMSMNVASIRGFARHFYNLALADVREEVERIYKENIDKDGERECGRLGVCIKIEKFIDNLTK